MWPKHSLEVAQIGSEGPEHDPDVAWMSSPQDLQGLSLDKDTLQTSGVTDKCLLQRETPTGPVPTFPLRPCVSWMATVQVFTGREERGPKFYEDAGVTTRASWNWWRKVKRVFLPPAL